MITVQPLPPTPEKKCIVCEGPCGAMCPACGRYVCHAYGYVKSCSLVHEQSCRGAKILRDGGKVQ